MVAVHIGRAKERGERHVAFHRRGPIEEVPARSIEVAKGAEGPERR